MSGSAALKTSLATMVVLNEAGSASEPSLLCSGTVDGISRNCSCRSFCRCNLHAWSGLLEAFGLSGTSLIEEKGGELTLDGELSSVPCMSDA